MSNFVKKYPTISMFVLAILIGGAVTAPMIADLVPSDSGMIIVAAYSASLAGVILTAIVSGKAGVRRMFRRLLIWRVGIGWWLYALFGLALMYLGGMVLGKLISGSSTDLSHVEPLYMFVPYFIMKFLLDAGLGEELGWRGFLLPRLQARHNALVASIMIGIVWGLWHLPLFMLEGQSPTYEIAQEYGVLPSLIGYSLVITIPWAILFTWVYNNTKGSLLLAFVFHASQAWMVLFLDQDNLFGPYGGYTAIMVVSAIIVVLIFGAKNLSRKHERIMIHDEESVAAGDEAQLA